MEGSGKRIVHQKSSKDEVAYSLLWMDKDTSSNIFEITIESNDSRLWESQQIPIFSETNTSGCKFHYCEFVLKYNVWSSDQNTIQNFLVLFDMS